jgi:hypothetical protein
VHTHLLVYTLLSSALLTSCTTERADPQTAPSDTSGRPDSKHRDAGRVDAGRLDAGRVDAGRVDGGRLDAGLAASDGSITRDEAGRIMRHGFFDPDFPICNSPMCVPVNTPCEEDMDCCQQAGWTDKRVCIGGYCGFLLPGFDPVWHDPIPVCTSDGGSPSR